MFSAGCWRNGYLKPANSALVAQKWEDDGLGRMFLNLLENKFMPGYLLHSQLASSKVTPIYFMNEA